MGETCDTYYQWSEYHQAVMELDARTEGMNCSELNSTAYDYLYHRNISTTWQPTRDPDPDMFCQQNITSSMIFNQLEVDPDLFDEWIIQLVGVSVALRVLAVIILWVINIEGFSWI